MKFNNFFRILDISDENHILLQEDGELEDVYCLAQMKLMKNQSKMEQTEFEEKFDLMNEAFEILKDENKRIEHFFEILEYKNLLSKESKILIEENCKKDFELMEFFFEINEKIENIKLINDSEKKQIHEIESNLLSEKNLFLKSLNEKIILSKYEDSYEIFLRMKYIFRALELLKNKEN